MYQWLTHNKDNLIQFSLAIYCVFTLVLLYNVLELTSQRSLEKFGQIDGCTVYRFTQGSNVNYFARCKADDKVAVTDSNGKYVITETEK